MGANEKIVDARLCTLEASMHEEDLFNPLIGQFDSDEFLLRVESVSHLLFRMRILKSIPSAITMWAQSEWTYRSATFSYAIEC